MGFMTSGRKHIAAILCGRDGCTFAEAERRIKKTVKLIDEAMLDDYEAVEEIMMEELGFEMDYLDLIL